ncbi:sugar phosphate isomerase/epimerase family protein [Taklimakanibacter deserti]|uniref:sugar phosphate isomerase/epimerase family protein n=1 Tax=Taklimakanibacter deserti TaxID=2267839 RepID=UPI0034D3E1ED
MPNLRSDLVFAMPFSNVLHLPFADKVKATRLAGLRQMTIQPQEVLKLVAEGLSIADMKSIAADGGIEIGRLDPLCPWVPDWRPTNFGADYARAHDISPKVFFDLCDELGCRYMSLNATFPASRYTNEQITGFYAEICRQAAEHGVTCDLECIPMWGVVSLEQGWKILKASGAKNGGFVFDCTHFTRSNPSLETLRQIPGNLSTASSSATAMSRCGRASRWNWNVSSGCGRGRVTSRSPPSSTRSMREAGSCRSGRKCSPPAWRPSRRRRLPTCRAGRCFSTRP